MRDTITSDSLTEDLDWWTTHLRSINRAPRTVDVYRDSVLDLDAFLAGRGMPRSIEHVTREHLEAYLLDIHTPKAQGGRGLSVSTALLRHRAIRVFFLWAVDEAKIRISPMERMKPPTVPVEPPPVLRVEQLSALMATCSGRTFPDLRDAVILRLLMDSGCRLAELTGMQVSDIDWTYKVIRVMGKGRRPRDVTFNGKTEIALRRYLAARRNHSHASLPNLWLGKYGATTASGIYQIVRDRGRQASLGDIRPHLFRHSVAHDWLAQGKSETGLMQLMGWKSPEMLRRYGASAANERARDEAHGRQSLSDRV